MPLPRRLTARHLRAPAAGLVVFAALLIHAVAGASGAVPATGATATAVKEPATTVAWQWQAAIPSVPSPSGVLRAYAAAFVEGHYDAMWRLLAPAAQADWSGLPAYAAYYRIKFAPVRIRGIVLGVPARAGSAVRIPLTLDLAWRMAGPAAAHRAPGVLSLFRNLNATLVRVPAGGTWRVSEGGPLDPSAPILPPLRPPARALRVPILMYHHISSLPPAESQVGLTVTDANFAAQLAYLAVHGYHTVRLVDLFNALYYGRPLPPNPVVLSFDDGYLDNYTDAFPLLRRQRMIGEFNVITAYAGTTLGVNSYMTWPQIATMAAAGMEIESHTVDHQDLGLVAPDHAAYEIHFSRAVLAGRIHHAVQFLAYPSGEPFRSESVAAQERIVALLRQFGYAGALLDPVTPATLQDAVAPYQLTRVRVSNDEPLAAFATNLRG